MPRLEDKPLPHTTQQVATVNSSVFVPPSLFIIWGVLASPAQLWDSTSLQLLPLPSTSDSDLVKVDLRILKPQPRLGPVLFLTTWETISSNVH